MSDSDLSDVTVKVVVIINARDLKSVKTGSAETEAGLVQCFQIVYQHEF